MWRNWPQLGHIPFLCLYNNPSPYFIVPQPSTLCWNKFQRSAVKQCVCVYMHLHKPADCKVNRIYQTFHRSFMCWRICISKARFRTGYCGPMDFLLGSCSSWKMKHIWNDLQSVTKRHHRTRKWSKWRRGCMVGAWAQAGHPEHFIPSNWIYLLGFPWAKWWLWILKRLTISGHYLNNFCPKSIKSCFCSSFPCPVPPS